MTPSGPPSALTSSTGGVVAGHRCLFILSKQSSLRVMGFVTLGRYGRLQREEN